MLHAIDDVVEGPGLGLPEAELVGRVVPVGLLQGVDPGARAVEG